MLGNIISIEGNLVVIKLSIDLTSKVGLLNIHVAFDSNGDTIIGEIVSLSLTEAKIMLLGEISNNNFISGVNKKVIMEVYNKDNELIDNLSSWSFELLEEKLSRKLNYVCFVEGDKKFSHNTLYVRYNKYKFYKLKKFSDFIQLLKRGQIRISFTLGVYKSGIKSGKMHDHGTQFSIRKENLKLLFDEIELE